MKTLDRTFRIALLLVSLLLVSGGLNAQSKSANSPGKSAQGKPDLSPSSLYARNKTSVVTIFTFDANKKPRKQGSGFIVAPNRVVTNYHVVEGSTEASVTFDDGTTASTDSVAAVSGPSDLVILTVKTGGRTPLQFGNELDAKVGETVYAIGSPQGLSASLSSGLVSAFREEGGRFLIQVTTSISPGSSGGPLFDSKGRVIGITSSELKDGSFGFAVGVSDLQHLLRVPLPAATTLADLLGAALAAGAEAREKAAPAPPHAAHTPLADLAPVQTLYVQKKYIDAANAFRRLPTDVQHSFDGELLLCKIQTADLKNPNTEACDAAISLMPNEPMPYYVRGLAELATRKLDRAEMSATKAVTHSGGVAAKNLLGLIFYMEEYYGLVPPLISEDQDDSFVLMLLEGAAFRSGDKEKALRLEGRVKSLRGSSGPWQSYWDGVAATNDGNFSEAKRDFRKCDADPDLMDSMCAAALADTEMKEGLFPQAKKDLDEALYRYYDASRLLDEAMLVRFFLGDKSGATELYQRLAKRHSGAGDSIDCVYYYGMDQPDMAYSHCLSNIKRKENSYGSWSDAGYVALDTGRYQIALDDFVKAGDTLKANSNQHRIPGQMDIVWGLILAAYMKGSTDTAKSIYSEVKKEYPEYSTMSGLEKLPIVWSTQTRALIAKATADLK